MNYDLESGKAMRCVGALACVLGAFSVFGQETNAVRLPETIVMAEKEPTYAQDTLLSVTPVNRATIEDANVLSVKDASVYAPNVYMAEFSARFLSNPRFRGVGSSPNNPGVTTYMDGVPQLNANSSSIELLDVEQVEFVRGPQGALFGRNTVGGLINILSRTPTFGTSAEAEILYGNYDRFEARARVSGTAIKDVAAVSLAAGYSARDGYTKNVVTGNDVDSREAFFGKAQVLLHASELFDVRLVFSGETSDDGDFALGDVGGLRANPNEVQHDFEGYTSRDVLMPTLLARYEGENVTISSTSGFVWWTTEAETDLDYTAAPLMTRKNEERQNQFTQEFQVASAEDKPVRVAENLDLSWQSGLFLFTQDYEQDSVNTLSPFITGAPVPLDDIAAADLEDWGMGIYAQGKLTFLERFDFVGGLRYDYESKDASLLTTVMPPSTFETRELEDDYAELTPRVALAWRPTEGQMAYVQVSKGYKAGGFNPISPADSEVYDQEESWNYELGYKCTWLDGRFRANIALFYIDWDDLQLNIPVITSPGRFYIANVGNADSKGVELETAYRPARWIELFGSVGYTDAEFGDGSSESGSDISGNPLPYTPEFTGNVGTQLTWPVNDRVRLYARAEVTVYGDFVYDSTDTEGQDTYSLANFRAGVGNARWFVEGWIQNAFGTEYVPIALPYSTAFAPSGYVGESGAPATYGVRGGVNF
jgi:iron complex outermembrane receptor protein